VRDRKNENWEVLVYEDIIITDLTLANLSILKTGKAKAIRFSTLEAICKALDCQPGDLLEYGRG
jgi:DNA-binding Xre family transcriptional regulator